MKTIWKFTGHNFPSSIQMPRGASVLSAQLQQGLITLWAVVDPEAPSDPRSVLIVGTGHPVDPAGMTFVDTVQDQMGLVWHVFVGDAS